MEVKKTSNNAIHSLVSFLKLKRRLEDFIGKKSIFSFFDKMGKFLSKYKEILSYKILNDKNKILVDELEKFISKNDEIEKVVYKKLMPENKKTEKPITEDELKEFIYKDKNVIEFYSEVISFLRENIKSDFITDEFLIDYLDDVNFSIKEYNSNFKSYSEYKFFQSSEEMDFDLDYFKKINSGLNLFIEIYNLCNMESSYVELEDIFNFQEGLVDKLNKFKERNKILKKEIKINKDSLEVIDQIKKNYEEIVDFFYSYKIKIKTETSNEKEYNLLGFLDEYLNILLTIFINEFVSKDFFKDRDCSNLLNVLKLIIEFKYFFLE